MTFVKRSQPLILWALILSAPSAEAELTRQKVFSLAVADFDTPANWTFTLDYLFPNVIGTGDFNEDGRDDLAFGGASSILNQGGQVLQDAGAVQLFFGSDSGLSPDQQQFLDPQVLSPGNTVSAEERFGFSVVAGDFDRGGDDLAIGISQDLTGVEEPGGSVAVFYDDTNGLDFSGGQTWNQDSPGVGGGPEPLDNFGYSQAIGDFDNDGFDDLVIGVPAEDLTGGANAGAFHVLRGSAGGLTQSASDYSIYSSASEFFPGNVEPGDFLGFSLAVGNFNCDSYDDLAIGAPGESFSGIGSSLGEVTVIYGSATGISNLVTPGFPFPEIRTETWYQGSDSVKGSPESGDRFGDTMVSGDFNGDGCDDLAISVPNENVNFEDTLLENAGAVNVLMGSASGLTAANDQLWTAASVNPALSPEEGGYFGRRLAAGDFNQDGRDDLAISSNSATACGQANAGRVVVLNGSGKGLTSQRSQVWDSYRLGGGPSSFFGRALAVGDWDNSGSDDLAIVESSRLWVLYSDTNELFESGFEDFCTET